MVETLPSSSMTYLNNINIQLNTMINLSHTLGKSTGNKHVQLIIKVYNRNL